MIFILQFLIFLLFATTAFYFPGKALLERIKINLGTLESVVVAPIIGIFIFTFILLIIRFFQLPFVCSYIFLLPIVALQIKKLHWSLPKIRVIKLHQLILIAILLVGSVTQTWHNFFSGFKTSEGVVFSSFHDTAFHLAVIGELKNHFPPEHPTFSGEPLKNYHYLTDFLISGITASIPVNNFDLYLRIIPFFTSLYFGLTSYVVASLLSKKYWVNNLAVFLVYFAGSFAFLIPIFRNGAHWGSGSFMIDQPFDLSLNPHNLFGFVIFLIGIYLVLKYEKIKKPFYLLLAGLIFASAFSFKSYASIIGMGALFTTSMYLVLFKKNLDCLKVFSASLIIFLISFILLIDNTRNGLYFLPGWTLDRMVEDAGRLDLPNLSILKQHYLEKHNYLRVSQIYLMELSLYAFGNLGIRVIGVIYLVLSLKNLKKIPVGKLFTLSAFLLAFFIPVLFNQGGTPYNVIQFGSYSLIVASIFTAICIEKIWIKLKLASRNALSVFLIFLIVILSLPVNVKTFIKRINPDKFEVTNNELRVLEFLKKSTDANSVILLLPSAKNSDFAYVSALSERRVFLADSVQVDLTNLDYDSRKKTANDFFYHYDLEQKNDFVRANNILYIYLTKSDKDNFDFSKVEAISDSVIETDDSALYKIN